MDPSCTIGFYCRSKEDFEDFCFHAAEVWMNDEQMNGWMINEQMNGQMNGTNSCDNKIN